MRALSGASAGVRIRTGDGTESPITSGAIRTLKRAGDRLDASWSTATVPAVMIRDRQSGEVLAILREGGTSLSQFGALDRLELLVSDGVKSELARIEPGTGAIRR